MKEKDDNHRKEKLIVAHSPKTKPEDWTRFIELKPFGRAWKKLGLDEDDRKAMQLFIMGGSDDHAVIPGTGGVKKMRFTSNRWSKGKSGGARVIYVYFKEFSLVLLITIYRKGKKEDITPKERKDIKNLVKGFEKLLKTGKIKL